MLYYDLIIVGGGLVGAGLAAALRDAELNIALIDAKLPSNDDPRLFALNSSSCQFLKNLGLWHELAPYAAPIHQVHVSHHGRFGAVRLNCEDINLPALGNVIPARHIEAALNKELTRLPTCTVYRPATLHALQQYDGYAHLKIITEQGTQDLQTPIVIGADGTESTVRAQLNIHTEMFDYEQSALVTRTTLKRLHHHIAYERFHSQGAIAMLPLMGNECATIWTADKKTIAQLMELPDQVFLQKLQTEFGYRLGRFQGVSQRHVFPLRMVYAKNNVEQCVYLLGNSAHTLHPIAAQGFNLALYEAAVLAEEIMERVNKQRPITTNDLHAISLRTEKQQATSIGISHRLARFFSNNSILLGFAVQLGMFGLDISPSMKKKFLERMIGRIGRVPRLLLSNGL
ncbi:MAG: FAD-dependent monooxygenase [Gammaproteobacteria bacterium]|nr:FAD-dependent monooxygenase [Gammaproteobacteria bacterium]MCW5583278.1 FAD-dependent monooxygenase [Gammaproteobacteria bacterium]